MAVNVTQKDKTLNEVIDICEHLMGNPPLHLPAFADGWNGALRAVIRRCRKRLGYTGSMPLEVPNQSEQAHVMTTALSATSAPKPNPTSTCGNSSDNPFTGRRQRNHDRSEDGNYVRQ